MNLPDFPWDALAPFANRARLHPEGIIDLSVGTPVDATPAFIQGALQKASNAPGYPTTAGTPELKGAISQWAIRMLGATGEFDVLPLIGSKELVAWLPTILEVKTVLFPEIAYPTYSVGAIIAGVTGVPVAIDPSSWPQSDFAWINSPSNPTGRVHSDSEISAVLEWSRKHKAIVVSDECYLEFGHGSTPKSILSFTGGDNSNVLAVHSLSKRSSMAGYRGAFLIGDPELITQIREVRKHAGMMVPFPVQHAMIAALGDDEHVAAQRGRYNQRRDLLTPALEAVGFVVEDSRAGLYIWCTRGESDWDSGSWLADLGILATPGHFYGEKGAKHLRVALTATDSQISAAAARLLAKR